MSEMILMQGNTRVYSMRAYYIFDPLLSNYSRRRRCSTLVSIESRERVRRWMLLQVGTLWHAGTVCELESSQEGGSAGCVTGRLSIHYPFRQVTTANKKLASRLMVGSRFHRSLRSNKSDGYVYMKTTSRDGHVPSLLDVNEIFL